MGLRNGLPEGKKSARLEKLGKLRVARKKCRDIIGVGLFVVGEFFRVLLKTFAIMRGKLVPGLGMGFYWLNCLMH